jgi:hypothetical protein
MDRQVVHSYARDLSAQSGGIRIGEPSGLPLLIPSDSSDWQQSCEESERRAVASPQPPWWAESSEWDQIRLVYFIPAADSRKSHAPRRSGYPEQSRQSDERKDGTFYIGEEATFRTLPTADDAPLNLALLEAGARVTAVSSNFGGAANGEFALAGASEPERFEIDATTSSLRLDVVESSGGNTGPVEFAAYGVPLDN